MTVARARNATISALAAALLTALSASAAAQSASAPTIEEPEPAWRCLIVRAVAIEYPPGMAAQKTGWQPHGKNEVGELERIDPNRREFIEWLRDVDVDVPKRRHDEIVGDSLNVAVPCGVLDLL